LGFNDSWIDSCYRNKHDEFVDEVDENLLQMLQLRGKFSNIIGENDQISSSDEEISSESRSKGNSKMKKKPHKFDLEAARSYL